MKRPDSALDVLATMDAKKYRVFPLRLDDATAIQNYVAWCEAQITDLTDATPPDPNQRPLPLES